jgi:epsin
LVEHLIKNGNERVVEEARDHMFKIRTLTDFNFYEGAIDRGNGGECQCEHPKRSLSIFTVLISWNSTSIRRSLFQTVREKARNVIELLQDNARIREERDKARQLREKFSGFSGQRDSGYGGYAGGGGGGYGGYNGGGGGGGGGGSSDNFYSGGSYANGGIGSTSFQARRRDGGGSRAERYSDSGNTGGGHSYDSYSSTQSSNNGRYSDELTASSGVASVSTKPKKFDIKINQSGKNGINTPPQAAVAPTAVSNAPEMDLFGLPDDPSSNNAHSTGGDYLSDASTFDAMQSAPAPPAPPPPTSVDLFSSSGFADFQGTPSPSTTSSQPVVPSTMMQQQSATMMRQQPEMMSQQQPEMMMQQQPGTLMHQQSTMMLQQQPAMATKQSLVQQAVTQQSVTQQPVIQSMRGTTGGSLSGQSAERPQVNLLRTYIDGSHLPCT